MVQERPHVYDGLALSINRLWISTGSSSIVLELYVAFLPGFRQ